jgi:hypothetical protein
VRVECAATALYAGFDQVVPFLLQSCASTPTPARPTAATFAVSPTTAWARGRAAEALAAYAGVPNTYRFDASMQQREAETARSRPCSPAGARGGRRDALSLRARMEPRTHAARTRIALAYALMLLVGGGLVWLVCRAGAGSRPRHRARAPSRAPRSSARRPCRACCWPWWW